MHRLNHQELITWALISWPFSIQLINHIIIIFYLTLPQVVLLIEFRDQILPGRIRPLYFLNIQLITFVNYPPQLLD